MIEIIIEVIQIIIHHHKFTIEIEDIITINIKVIGLYKEFGLNLLMIEDGTLLIIINMGNGLKVDMKTLETRQGYYQEERIWVRR